jgi:hypothetical protein
MRKRTPEGPSNPYHWLPLAGIAWMIFLVYGFVSAQKLKSIKLRGSQKERFLQIIFMAAANSWLFNDALGSGWLVRRCWPASTTSGEIGVAATIAWESLLPCGHAGVLVAFAGSAPTLGEYRAVLPFAIVLVAFYRKAKKEERFLGQEFGEKFREPAGRTGMFLPKFSGHP